MSVSISALDDCSVYSTHLINYYLKDESAQTLINNSNSTIETTIYLKSIQGNIISNISKNFTGNSIPSICISAGINTSGLRLWEQSRYGSNNYQYESHNIQNASMTSLPINYTLLDLSSSEATKFLITYKSSTFLPVQNAVLDIQRNYLGEGVYKSIEIPLTDSSGSASASFDLNAVNYRINVMQNGILLGTFENPAIVCSNSLTGDCTINLNQNQLINLINNYDTENDFGYSLTYDNNRTISLIFNIPSGVSKTVNLFVNQTSILGNLTSCNQTLYATSGELDCTIDPTLGDVQTSIFVTLDGNLLTTGSQQILEDRSTYFGTDNIVLTFFLVLSLVLLLISDPILVLIGVVVGLIGAGLLLLLNSGSPFGTVSVLMYLVIAIVLIIIKISARRDRNI